ncbi:MAG: DinB family protein [Planctomycetota bacterium]|jgi:uncharacterized damage-inducible protein DinB
MMEWTGFLTDRVKEVYGATRGLLAQVEETSLDWRPGTGENWMSMGQLLAHLETACGFCMRGFVTGDWSTPDGGDIAEMTEEEMLPSADRMPAASGVEAVLEALAADEALALAMIAEAGEGDLAARQVTAPWDPRPAPLGVQLHFCVVHLEQHKAQLFFYLKSLGVPVHTGSLYGMA